MWRTSGKGLTTLFKLQLFKLYTVKKLNFLNLLFNLLVVALISSIMVANFETDPRETFACVLVAVSFLNMAVAASKGQLRNIMPMAVQTETWEHMIAENLFKDYPFITRAKDRTGNVIDNKVVHIPQAGAKPGARKNRENFPLPIVKRNDLDITYPIDEISTEATYIPDAEKYELSYDKHASVIKDHFGVLNEESAKDILDRWYVSDSSKMVRTTGADTAVYLSGQTGTRNKFMVADIEAAKTILVADTKRENGPRALIMSEGAYNQLKADPVVKDKDTMESVGAVWKDGDLVKIHGFDIYRTDVTGRYDNTATPVLKDYTEGPDGYAATDNDVMLLVDFNHVHYAKGSVKFFENLDDAVMQGDIYSAKVRVGGRKERNDQIGVVAIIQEP
jgi:hypothetical protein